MMSLGVPATLRMLATIVLRGGATSYMHAGMSKATSKGLANKSLVCILSTTCLQLLSVVFVVLQFDMLVERAFGSSIFNRHRLGTGKITGFIGTNE